MAAQRMQGLMGYDTHHKNNRLLLPFTPAKSVIIINKNSIKFQGNIFVYSEMISFNPQNSR